MSGYKILFSNIGYAKGIDGSLKSHFFYFHRHFYAGPMVQKQILDQVKEVVEREQPDLCCFVEIDQGSLHSGYYNQLESFLDGEYAFYDIADKYGANSVLGRLPLHTGKSNAFVARQEMPFQRLNFRSGAKRLVYKIDLPNAATLFFAHFSLNRKVRIKQFAEIRRFIDRTEGEVILLADFNILYGFSELKPLLDDGDLKILNKEDEYTFSFHHRQHTLDLCLCSIGLEDRIDLKVIPQPYSDHEALLVEIAAS